MVRLSVRSVLLLLPLAGLLTAGGAMAAPRDCVSTPQARILAQSGKIVPLIQALRAARQAAGGGGEMIDSRLCNAGPNRLEYTVIFLQQDGRVRRVTVDAQSGALVRAR